MTTHDQTHPITKTASDPQTSASIIIEIIEPRAPGLFALGRH